MRFSTPERNPVTTRDVEYEDDTTGEHNKHRRATGDDTMDSIGKMNEDDRRILTAAISGFDITEVYSPVWVAAVAAKLGLTPGTSFHRTNSWDFSKDSHRTSAWKLIKEQDPYCIIGSPPCTMFSMLQELIKSAKKSDPA